MNALLAPGQDSARGIRWSFSTGEAEAPAPGWSGPTDYSHLWIYFRIVPCYGFGNR